LIEQKSIGSKDKFLGQFMTPIDCATELVSSVKFDRSHHFAEPSFGTGNFIKALNSIGILDDNIFGCELDTKLYNESKIKNKNLKNINFYDYNNIFEREVNFVGNVPFRSPALSLTTHKSILQRLTRKYGVVGIREEAVFFILKTIELIENSNRGGTINYITPKSIFTNNSKFYKKFREVLNKKFDIIAMVDVDSNRFENVSLPMVFISMKYNPHSVDDYFDEGEEYWDYRKIFKRTYLGSVPCESIFLSAPDESMKDFIDRLTRLYKSDKKDLLSNLKHNGKAHLRVLNSDNKELVNKKIDIIHEYLIDIYARYGDSFLYLLSNEKYYKEINHRHSVRYYFRNKLLKKCKFVYEINPNPCKSFYFTGNPSYSSTDYFGYCDYDITRNSSPGACRTIPLENLENNITDEFKVWWKANVNKDYIEIFNIFSKTYKSKWYKDMKKKYNRFYFGIPMDLKLLAK
jgi:hypothetical protein